jgi:transitional endoplasmic reticulum ATPase
MPLAKDVDLDRVAEMTHGFVGADLQALMREAAMIALRTILPHIDFEMADIPYDTLMKLEVTMENILDAMKEVEPSAIREVFVEVPDVSWDDVGGLESMKQTLKEAVEWPLKHADIFLKTHSTPPKGILLTGLPGTGKTLLAKAVAKQSGVNFISVKGPELISRYIGESERAIRQVFKTAKQASPTILFFDEIDSLLPRRGSAGTDSHVAERVVSQFLTEMDGIEELKGVVVLAATNRLDIIDPALLRCGRFDFILEMPLPDEKTREAIFRIHTRGKPLARDVNLAELARLTEGKVGSDIERHWRPFVSFWKRPGGQRGRRLPEDISSRFCRRRENGRRRFPHKKKPRLSRKGRHVLFKSLHLLRHPFNGAARSEPPGKNTGAGENRQ